MKRQGVTPGAKYLILHPPAMAPQIFNIHLPDLILGDDFAQHNVIVGAVILSGTQRESLVGLAL